MNSAERIRLRDLDGATCEGRGSVPVGYPDLTNLPGSFQGIIPGETRGTVTPIPEDTTQEEDRTIQERPALQLPDMPQLRELTVNQ